MNIYWAILLTNCIVFIVLRFVLLQNDGLAGDLDTHIGSADSNEMTYLIAGNLNQPKTAFAFMRSLFGPNYTFVNFERWGFSASSTANLIADDIIKNGYSAKIYTISLGDHVARYLEKHLPNNVEVYAINPCPRREVLQMSRLMQTLVVIALPVVAIFCHGLGFLSLLPIPSFGGGYSPILLLDQYWCIFYDNPPLRTTKTYGVICSCSVDDAHCDGLLNNDKIEDHYPDAEIIYIRAGHADTVKHASEYLEAIRTLLKDPC